MVPRGMTYLQNMTVFPGCDLFSLMVAAFLGITWCPDCDLPGYDLFPRHCCGFPANDLFSLMGVALIDGTHPVQLNS